MEQVIVGPGGCKTPEECKTYCEAHPDECKNLQPVSGGMGISGNPVPGVSSPTVQIIVGPGGCKTPDECATYCQQNPQACQNFSPSAGQMPNQPAGSIQPQMPINNQVQMGGPGAGGGMAPGDAQPGQLPMMPSQQLNEMLPTSPQNQPTSGQQLPVPSVQMNGQQQQNPAPPPTGQTPPPTSWLSPLSFLASIVNAFKDLFIR
jgi:hypothetical protein